MITLHIGKFFARETILICPTCGRIYHSEELSRIVAGSCNFGYDVIAYVGKALFQDHLADEMVIKRLSEKNIDISASEVSYLGKKFIVYLTLLHRKSASRIKEAMALKGGYILHLDATYEDNSPMLMIGMDSIMKIVLGNIKLSGENSDEIIPFLKDIKNLFGDPLALVHDMSKGIGKAVGKVFPGILDFICHFHFLRDIGKDLLAQEYDNIRKRLKAHGIKSKLNQSLRALKKDIDAIPEHIDVLYDGINEKQVSFEKSLAHIPLLAAYTLIHWALDGQHQGDGYGFPFDRPHLTLAKRLKRIHDEIDQLRKIRLRDNFIDNMPLHQAFLDLENIINDQSLWRSVEVIESEIEIFDDLRKALRLAPQKGKQGLNDNGTSGDIRMIEHGVKVFREKIVKNQNYPKNKKLQAMIVQIDKYWEKLFADPIKVETPNGIVCIYPQRTNNIEETEFRDLKRGYRKKTGNNSLGKTLKSMLENTPLVKNLNNSEYLSILLDGKSSLEEAFADIEINDVRIELKRVQHNPEKIPAKLKKLTCKETYPDKLKRLFVGLKSNGILC